MKRSPPLYRRCVPERAPAQGRLLPQNMQVVVLPLAWLAILVLPVLAARAVRLRLGRAQ